MPPYDSKAAQARKLREKREAEWARDMAESQERHDRIEHCANVLHDKCNDCECGCHPDLSASERFYLRRLIEKINV